MTRTPSTIILTASILVAGLSISGRAHAYIHSHCFDSAPSSYIGAYCAPEGAWICQESGSMLTCYLDPTRTSATQGATAYAVTEGFGGGADITVWGTDGFGNEFCCPVYDGDGSIDTVVLEGTEHADSIVLYSSAYRLSVHHAGYLNAWIYGDGGDDTIRGSRTSNVDYQEWLFGETGSDYLYGNQGDDRLYGGLGSDQLYGGSGDDVLEGDITDSSTCTPSCDDYISGGYGDDIIYGGPGEDDLFGGYGDDRTSGGAGLDHHYGQYDDDTLCDNAFNANYFDGGDGSDTLWQPWSLFIGTYAPDGDSTGGLGLDGCGHSNWSFGSCEVSLQSKPSACPG